MLLGWACPLNGSSALDRPLASGLLEEALQNVGGFFCLMFVILKAQKFMGQYLVQYFSSR
jgi:hypothetical protein